MEGTGQGRTSLHVDRDPSTRIDFFFICKPVNHDIRKSICLSSLPVTSLLLMRLGQRCL